MNVRLACKTMFILFKAFLDQKGIVKNKTSLDPTSSIPKFAKGGLTPFRYLKKIIRLLLQASTFIYFRSGREN